MKKTYNVAWSENLSVNVKAENPDEAIEKIYQNQYDEGQVSAELGQPPEAFEIK